jgi:hypothetical protein
MCVATIAAPNLIRQNSLTTRPVRRARTALYVKGRPAHPQAPVRSMQEKQWQRKAGAPRTRRRGKHTPDAWERSSGNSPHRLLASD